MDTNKNSYTIVYAIIMVTVVALLLAFVSGALKDKQTENVELDKKKQILSALNGLKRSRCGGIVQSIYSASHCYK